MKWGNEIVDLMYKEGWQCIGYHFRKLQNLYFFKLKIHYNKNTQLYGHGNWTNSKFLQTNNIANSFH